MVVRAAKRTTRKPAARKPAPRKTVARKAVTRKTVTRKAVTRKAVTRKTVTRKTVSRKKPTGPGKPAQIRVSTGNKKVSTARIRKNASHTRVSPQVVAKKIKPEKPPAPKKTIIISGRVSAPAVRLGMTPTEVRETTGKPECILFGSDDHVEWQFGTRGFDVVGAATLYVTTLTFASGRVVRITERMSEALP